MSANLSIDGARAKPEVLRSWRDPPSRVDPHVEASHKSSVSSPSGSEGVPKKASREEQERNIQEALARLNEEMRKNDRSLHFSRDKEINRMVITVKNSTSGEVIRQIPDEAILRVAHNIEAIKGLIVNHLT